MSEQPCHPRDPEPLVLLLSTVAAVAALGAYLETRRQRTDGHEGLRKEVASVTRRCERWLHDFASVLIGYQHFVETHDLSSTRASYGQVRLNLSEDEMAYFDELVKQAHWVGEGLIQAFDDLSNFLDPDRYGERVNDIQKRVGRITGYVNDESYIAVYETSAVLTREVSGLVQSVKDDWELT